MKTSDYHALLRRIIATLIVSVSIFLQFYGSKIQKGEIRVEYVALDEIIAEEKARIQKRPSAKKTKFFFGKIDPALCLLNEIVRDRNNEGGVFVIITKTKITGVCVRSISKEVYLEIIRRLELDSS